MVPGARFVAWGALCVVPVECILVEGECWVVPVERILVGEELVVAAEDFVVVDVCGSVFFLLFDLHR